jgi:nicotinamide-nucleotide amidase
MKIDIQVISNFLKRRQYSLATAESCTGGLIAAQLTEIPGSSGWFEGGIVTYSNRSKTEWLGVKENTLKQYGAVSEETAREMVEGLLKNSHAEMGIAVTGIAGPGGGSYEKPVGTVCFAWRLKMDTYAAVHHFHGDRSQVRQQSVATALGYLAQLCASE